VAKRQNANAGPNDDKKRKKKVGSQITVEKKTCVMDPSTIPREKEKEGKVLMRMTGPLRAKRRREGRQKARVRWASFG
jgi:hypothetical protein